MKRLWMAALLLVAAAQGSRADLAAYLAKPEPGYRWEKRSETAIQGGKIYDLQMVSQKWQGIVWRHRIQLFMPSKPTNGAFCTLLNTGGSGSIEEQMLGMMVARQTGSPFAVLYNIPNQPLYGKNEDALIVHTWQRYLETGDESWPLHFPMAKAVLKAMDALQALTVREKLTKLTGFLVTGASKRGWTTWLVGASNDKRVKAIAPMVIDILNVPAQIKHQIAAYGKPSEQVDDYTAVGMEKMLLTKQGRRLMELEDPYSYRKLLVMPKLIILGTNDRYWSQDALNLYWSGLIGPKWVAYIPNSGHGLEDRARVLSTLGAFAKTVAAGKTFPRMAWKYAPTADGVKLTVTSSPAPTSARLFSVAAPTQDFRDQRWSSKPVPVAGNGFSVTHKAPESGFGACYAELTFMKDGLPFTLTTQIRILGE